MTRGSKAGHARERQVRKVLEADDWYVMRSAASLGLCDLICLRAGSTPMMVEVKSTVRPYEGFSPADRRALKTVAEMAGADAMLAWWPKNGKLRWIPSYEWPT